MPAYDSIREQIISTLTNRPSGEEIQPEQHQDIALAVLDYVRSIEAVMTSALAGVARVNTMPTQPDDSAVTYVSTIPPEQTATYEHFKGSNGEPLTITTDVNEAKFVLFVWNKAYWDYVDISISTTVEQTTDNESQS